MKIAHRRPDGTFEYEGELYRLEDREPDHFAVRRVNDGAVVGGLRFANGRDHEDVEVDGPASRADVVDAIARVVGAGRGLLPLQ